MKICRNQYFVIVEAKERNFKWIDPINDDEERNDGLAGRVYG